MTIIIIDTSDASRIFLGWHPAEKIPKFMPPDTLEMQFLVMSVLRFLCKTFSKLLKLTLQKTLLCE